MDNNNTAQNKGKSAVLTVIGLTVMLLLSLTQLIPSLRMAGFSVFVGIAFFFIVEAVAKTPKEQSGLRFKTFVSDIKKPGVLLWVLLPVVTGIVPLLLGDAIFQSGFSAHVIGRTSGMLSFGTLILLALQVIVLALGEEIAYRGFFLGKSMQKLPFWVCAVGSSILFAMGHIATGDTWLVLYDVSWVFIDSMIFSVIYQKTGNCLISAVSHIIGNAVGLLACLILL